MERKVQLCESCQDFTGKYGCPWTDVGLDGKVKFEPVPGWTAKKVPCAGAKTSEGFTYEITACPLYIPDPPREEVKACE